MHQVKVVSPQELGFALERGGVKVLDVRPNDLFEQVRPASEQPRSRATSIAAHSAIPPPLPSHQQHRGIAAMPARCLSTHPSSTTRLCACLPAFHLCTNWHARARQCHSCLHRAPPSRTDASRALLSRVLLLSPPLLHPSWAHLLGLHSPPSSTNKVVHVPRRGTFPAPSTSPSTSPLKGGACHSPAAWLALCLHRCSVPSL
jgi:hypothetical protein